MYKNFVFCREENISDGYVLKNSDKGVIFERQKNGKIEQIDILEGANLMCEETYKQCRQIAYQRAGKAQKVYVCL